MMPMRSLRMFPMSAPAGCGDPGSGASDRWKGGAGPVRSKRAWRLTRIAGSRVGRGAEKWEWDAAPRVRADCVWQSAPAKRILQRYIPQGYISRARGDAGTRRAAPPKGHDGAIAGAQAHGGAEDHRVRAEPGRRPPLSHRLPAFPLRRQVRPAARGHAGPALPLLRRAAGPPARVDPVEGLRQNGRLAWKAALGLGALVAPAMPAAAQAPPRALAPVLESLRRTNEWTLEQQVSICEIPAPPFGEAARAAAF